MVNDDHDARDADQMERRSVASMDIPLTLGQFAASMDIPLTLAGEDDCGQIRKIVVSKDKLTRTARLFTAGGHLGSRTISLPAFEMEGEESDHRVETNPQDPLLLALIERFAASMDIPLTLAENDDTQKLSEDGLAQTAGLTTAGGETITTAGGRLNFIHASLPNLERIDSSDSQQITLPQRGGGGGGGPLSVVSSNPAINHREQTHSPLLRASLQHTGRTHQTA
ncbi:hypothetical protein SRHO_G00101270 [Serrasalmus rhombeus]